MSVATCVATGLLLGSLVFAEADYQQQTVDLLITKGYTIDLPLVLPATASYTVDIDSIFMISPEGHIVKVRKDGTILGLRTGAVAPSK